MQPVESSNVQAIGYDPDTHTMHVAFRGGTTYEYQGIQPEAHELLMKSDSKGRHLHKHITSRHEGKRLFQ